MPRPIRIAILTNTFPPEFGAAPSRIFDMAKGLKHAGFEVEIFTGMPSYPLNEVQTAYRHRIFSSEILEEITVHRHWIWPYNGGSLWLRALAMLSLPASMWLFSGYRLLRGNFKYVYVQYPPMMLASLVALPLSKIRGAKLLLNLSDLWPSAIVDLGMMHKGLIYNLLDNISNHLYQSTHACLAQSEEIVAHLVARTSKPVLLYRTGVDCQKFLPKPTIARNGNLRIVYAGTLGLAHGVLALCKAVNFKKLGAELHIYGDGAERNELLQYLEENKRSDIHWRGSLSNEAIPSILCKFDAALVCQKSPIKGTVPSKIYEAMATALPILFHGAGEGGQLIETAGAGLCSPPNDYNQLIINIQAVALMSNDELEVMGKNGRKSAETRFERQTQIVKFCEWLFLDSYSLSSEEPK